VIIFLDEEHEREQEADVHERLLYAIQQVMIILQNILNHMAAEL